MGTTRSLLTELCCLLNPQYLSATMKMDGGYLTVTVTSFSSSKEPGQRPKRIAKLWIPTL